MIPIDSLSFGVSCSDSHIMSHVSASGTLDLQGRGRPLLNFNPSGDDDDDDDVDDDNVNEPDSTACADSNTKPSRELRKAKASNLVKDDAYKFNIDDFNDDDDDDDAFESLKTRNRRVKATEGNKKKINNVATETQALQDVKNVVSADDSSKRFIVRGNTNKEVKKLTHEKVIKLGQLLPASTERMLKGPTRNASKSTSLVVQDTKHNARQAATSVLVEETQDMDQGWDQDTKLAIEQSQADLVVAETQGIDIENIDGDDLVISSARNGERFKNDMQKGKLMDYKIPRHSHVRGHRKVVNTGNNEKDSSVVTHDKGAKRSKPPVVLETQDLDLEDRQMPRKKAKLRRRCFQLGSDSSDSETVPDSQETENVVNDVVVSESQPAGMVRRLSGSIKSTFQKVADFITSASGKVESERQVRGEVEVGDGNQPLSPVMKKRKLCNPDFVVLENAGRDKGCGYAHTTFVDNILTADGGSNDYEPVVLGGNNAGKASRGQKKGKTVFDEDVVQEASRLVSIKNYDDLRVLDDDSLSSSQGSLSPMVDNEGNIYGTQVSEIHRRMGRLRSSRKGGVTSKAAEHELLLLDNSDEDDGLKVKKETNVSSYSRTHTVQSGNQTSGHSAESMKWTTEGFFLKAEDATLQPGVSSIQMGSDGVRSSHESEGLRRGTTDEHRRNAGDLVSSQHGQENTSSSQQVSISYTWV